MNTFLQSKSKWYAQTSFCTSGLASTRRIYNTLAQRHMLLFLLSPVRSVVLLKKCIVELVSELCKVCLQSHAKLLTNLLTNMYTVHKWD